MTKSYPRDREATCCRGHSRPAPRLRRGWQLLPAAILCLLAAIPTVAQDRNGQPSSGRPPSRPTTAPAVANPQPPQPRGPDCLTAGCHASLAEPKFLHGVTVATECDSCHQETDRNNHKYRLVAQPPALCLDCHVDTEEEFEDAGTGLHKHAPFKQGKCLDCHEPHASNHEMLLRADPEDICLLCHQKEYAAYTALAHLHPPVEDKECTSCHTSHTSPYGMLLVEPFSAELYVPYDDGDSFALCFECHDLEMLEEEETDQATDFRNGELNLHHLHVNRESKGRSCRFCHLPHASNQHRLIRSSVRMGAWDMRIRYTPTQNGGYCGPACHPAKRYDRELPVDFSKQPTAPTAQQDRPLLPAEGVETPAGAPAAGDTK